ncbi:MAG: hypothetical protein LWX07_12940 [Bacteroidetes bacterium]|nr:hypothetical protein [Bacteroidota bacterium]
MKKSSIVFVLTVLIILSGCIFRKQETDNVLTGNKRTAATKNEGNVWLERFSIGAFHDGMDCGNNYSVTDKLGFNIWHRYSLGSDYDESSNRIIPKMDWFPCGNSKIDD